MGRFGKFVGTVIVAGTLAASAHAQEAPPLPDSMGALGDSITAGALANFRRQDIWNPLVELKLLPKLLLFFATGNARAVERRDFSWATGTNPFVVNSHATRLHRLRGWKPMRIHNSAISGATSTDVLREQLPELMEWSWEHLGQEAPDYVPILIGPNDICAKDVSGMVPTTRFVGNLAETVDRLLSRSPRTHILISSIPNIESLRGVAKDARHVGRAPLKTCADFWKLANVCPTLTLEDNPANRLMIAARVREYNEGLEELARTRAAQYGDRIRYAGEAYGIPFTANDVSLDCFHPNAHGHEMLSEHGWNASWWK